MQHSLLLTYSKVKIVYNREKFFYVSKMKTNYSFGLKSWNKSAYYIISINSLLKKNTLGKDHLHKLSNMKESLIKKNLQSKSLISLSYHKNNIFIVFKNPFLMKFLYLSFCKNLSFTKFTRIKKIFIWLWNISKADNFNKQYFQKETFVRKIHVLIWNKF